MVVIQLASKGAQLGRGVGALASGYAQGSQTKRSQDIAENRNAIWAQQNAIRQQAQDFAEQVQAQTRVDLQKESAALAELLAGQASPAMQKARGPARSMNLANVSDIIRDPMTLPGRRQAFEQERQMAGGMERRMSSIQEKLKDLSPTSLRTLAPILQQQASGLRARQHGQMFAQAFTKDVNNIAASMQQRMVKLGMNADGFNAAIQGLASLVQNNPEAADDAYERLFSLLDEFNERITWQQSANQFETEFIKPLEDRGASLSTQEQAKLQQLRGVEFAISIGMPGDTAKGKALAINEDPNVLAHAVNDAVVAGIKGWIPDVSKEVADISERIASLGSEDDRMKEWAGYVPEAFERTEEGLFGFGGGDFKLKSGWNTAKLEATLRQRMMNGRVEQLQGLTGAVGAQQAAPKQDMGSQIDALRAQGKSWEEIEAILRQ